MTLRYQVDSKLPEPVFITVEEIIEIVSEMDYRAKVAPVKDFHPEAHLFTFAPPHLRPVGSGAFHPNFFEWYQPVVLDTGELTAIRKPEGRELKVGDHVWYDVRWDDMTLFDIEEFPRKLTLVEKTDVPATAG